MDNLSTGRSCYSPGHIFKADPHKINLSKTGFVSKINKMSAVRTKEVVVRGGPPFDLLVCRVGSI